MAAINAFETKSRDIKEQIIEKYLPLVKYIASRVIIGKSKYIEFEDLVSYGIIGLIDAVNKFDETKGMKFTSYASIRIKGSMIDEIRKNSPISKGAMDKLNRYNDTVEYLEKELIREPSYDEIAKKMGISVSEISEIESVVNYISIVSLEDLIFSDDDDMPLMGTIEDQNSPSPERKFEEKEKLEYLSKALENLNEKDKLVLSLYYYKRFTLKQIGKVLNVSESRVCQLHSRAILHLRRLLTKMNYN